jgi:2-iminoacetate synthase
MSFYEAIESHRAFDFPGRLVAVSGETVAAILDKDNVTPHDYLALLSDAALPFLEPMAARAQAIKKKQFGNVVFLFTPLYISNYCDNVCPYCSFAGQHTIGRRQLSPAQVRDEAAAIAATGMRNILLLTGESRRHAPPLYLKQAVALLREYFATISIEVFPMTGEEYRDLINEGVDGLTLYQEVYDEQVYAALHRGGPKQDYHFRLDAPERAACMGMRSVTVGTLLGLNDPVKEAYFCGLHARYLQRKFPSLEVSVSFPRLRPMAGRFEAPVQISDRRFVQLLLATRLFLPNCGITVSTRESKEMRNHLVTLGITKMSAGVSTAVGGRLDEIGSTGQFEIADTRTLEQVTSDLGRLGFQAVLHDWNSKYARDGTRHASDKEVLALH